MTLASINSLGPVTLGSTTLAAANLRVSPNIASLSHRTAGLEFPSVQAVVGSAPRATFSTPFVEAYTALGLKGTALTTANLYLAKFASGIRSTSNVHTKYALTASAVAFGYIKRISCQHEQVAMADVELVYTSSDGQAHPITASTSNAIPSLSASPLLRTIGPATINGTTTGGISGIDVDLGASIDTIQSDGNLFPTVCAYEGGTPVITCEHMDPDALRAAIGLTGSALASSFIIYFRDIDATTQLASTTGVSLTVASGRVMPAEWVADNLATAKGGLRVECLSTGATHPIVVATGASVPTP